MSSFLSTAPKSVPTLFPGRTRPTNPLLRRTHNVGFSSDQRPLVRGARGMVRFGFGHVPFPDPESAKGLIKDLIGRANGFLYPIAHAAVSSDAISGSQPGGDWLSGIIIDMGGVLKVLKDGLSAVHVPYAYGFAIILLAVLVKVATFPLTKNQIKSAIAMRSLQPQIKVIQQRYAGDQERIRLETARLYELSGFNPLAGCLPILATVPVWIGIYRALTNVADEGLLTEGFFWIPSLAGPTAIATWQLGGLLTEGFFWIPSLAGPTAIATRQGGSAISWIFSFVDGHPLLGWPDTLAYLVLPVLLVLAQYIIVQIMQSSQANDPSLKSSQSVTKFLPLLIGFFALLIPSGLSLYWFTNTILSTAQQVWIKKSWVAENSLGKLSDTIIEEEPPQVQTPILLTSTTEKEPRAETLAPQGPHPGERFEQIKEQEERRRQQREEEKRKREEATVNATQTPLSVEKAAVNGNPEKEEAVAAIGKPDDKVSGEDMIQDRSE